MLFLTKYETYYFIYCLCFSIINKCEAGLCYYYCILKAVRPWISGSCHLAYKDQEFTSTANASKVRATLCWVLLYRHVSFVSFYTSLFVSLTLWFSPCWSQTPVAIKISYSLSVLSQQSSFIPSLKLEYTRRSAKDENKYFLDSSLFRDILPHFLGYREHTAKSSFHSCMLSCKSCSRNVSAPLLRQSQSSHLWPFLSGLEVCV